MRETLDFFLQFERNDAIALLLYWLPFLVCILGYTGRTWANYQKDLAQRAASLDPDAAGGRGVFYVPTDRVGDVLGRVLVSVVPGFNLYAAAFDLAPQMLRRFFSVLARVFDRPLVPRP